MTPAPVSRVCQALLALPVKMAALAEMVVMAMVQRLPARAALAGKAVLAMA